MLLRAVRASRAPVQRALSSRPISSLVECVPNFSEGRDQSVIDALSNAVKNVPGCSLIDVDPGTPATRPHARVGRARLAFRRVAPPHTVHSLAGASTNRTVYTFVGSPDAVIEGALAMARVARERIDMRNHSGEHPRFGAMDVCPFVPVRGCGMQDCVDISQEFGSRAAAELGIPLYLYEDAVAPGPELDYRRLLPDVRAGEYEGLAARIGSPEWKPDFGPASFVPEWGATATGARKFLLAYNVNLLGTKQQANRIAFNVREQGRGVDEKGRLKYTKGIGWYVDEYNMAQVFPPAPRLHHNLADLYITYI